MTSMIQGSGATAKVSLSENKGLISITGPNSTGVYNTGEFLMNTATAKIDVAGRQSIGLYAKGQEAKTKTELKAGTVQASNSGVGLYSDKSIVNLDNTSNNLKLIANNGGLLFYNYESNNAANVANGVFKLTGNVKATINNGGYAFYLKGFEGVETFLQVVAMVGVYDQRHMRDGMDEGVVGDFTFFDKR